MLHSLKLVTTIKSTYINVSSTSMTMTVHSSYKKLKNFVKKWLCMNKMNIWFGILQDQMKCHATWRSGLWNRKFTVLKMNFCQMLIVIFKQNAFSWFVIYGFPFVQSEMYAYPCNSHNIDSYSKNLRVFLEYFQNRFILTAVCQFYFS